MIGGRIVAEISAQGVKALRDQTGAGMMDCKRALTDAGGDLEKATDLLRERGLAKAGKREGRETSEGTIAMALQSSAGSLVELGCETDFVAKTPDFQALGRELAEAVVADPGLGETDALLAATVAGASVGDRIKGAVGRMGENIVLKRVARLAVEGAGRVGGYVHAGGKLGVIVSLETAVADESIDALAKDLAMHIAAADPTPLAVDRDGVPEDRLDHEREIFRRQAEQEGKPAQVVERIVEGRIAKYYKEVCLLEQAFVKDPDHSVRQLLEEAGERMGGEINVGGFVRFRLGEAGEG
jgi:elongation factor Ts